MWFGKRPFVSILVVQWILLPVTASAEFSPSRHTKYLRLFARGDCKTTTVALGDTCGSLASRCGISAEDFDKYNPGPFSCSNVLLGERVCCSRGTLADTKPKPNTDGSCAAYTVKQDDTCSTIADASGCTVLDLISFNDETTWGWSGCDQLGAHLTICLSKGTPPMPQSIENAVCGPLKPGSKLPTGGQTLADLNPCPLNACCTRLGQCGITPEYCTKRAGPTGNPGTAPTGQNGCISNCETRIVNNGARPSSVVSIGYYESWNFNRPCLNMRADSVDTSKYTHYHWAFATITSTFDVSINDTYNQWSRFKGLQGIKRIVTFGEWGFSTDSLTYDVLREAMNPSNAGRFASNIVRFLNKNNLDGVDFNWEYPGAPDVPGIPPGLETDAPNYLAFLELLHGQMPKGKTVSIAAPASYLHLKQFPISKMAKALDYIVYMTYDLHGQWDYGNKWSQDGCPSGSCLRSHVNLTETNYALAMITKAGVPSNKITVGISSYGREFGMTKNGCIGPMCHFEGPRSMATPGDCTATAGYISNAEISLIIGSNVTGTSSWYDYDSNSNLLVYGDNQWVAYMDDATRSSRTSYYQSLNFLGTVDWAVDLLEFGEDDGDPNDNGDDNLPPTRPLPPCDATYDTMEDLDAAASSIPNNCKALYTVATLSNVLGTAVKNYTDIMNNGYDGKFHTYAQAVADSAGTSVHDFVTNHGSNYFSCLVSEASLCCSDCKGHNGNGAGDPCAYCFDGTCSQTTESLMAITSFSNTTTSNSTTASNSAFTNSTIGARGLSERDRPHPVQTPIVKVVNESEPCPPEYTKRGFGPDNPYEQSIYWTLLPDKAHRFYADLLGDTGIPKDKIDFGNYDRGNACPPAATLGDGNDCWGTGMDFGIPEPNGYGTKDVANPRDVVQKALDNSDNLQQQISDTLIALSLDAYYGDDYELVDAISIPVLMIADAVENMAQVESVADEIDEEKKKALILSFISAILFFVPIAGEVLGSVAELADLVGILAIVSAAGDVAMGIYSVVDDPKNPLLGIMSIILAPLALTNLVKISEAANLRRGMSEEDIVKLGGKIGARMGTIKKVIGACHKALS